MTISTPPALRAPSSTGANPPTGAAPRAFPGPFRAPEKYQLLRALGTGGMGSVLLARDRQLGRLVALKFLGETCTTFLERFRREAQLTARLAHPAILRVHEFDTFEGRPYLAMQYIDGGNLALARLSPRASVRTLRRVVDALAFAHAHGIVHRDVKPENVLLDRRGKAFLSDFGLALDPDEGSSRDRARPVVGTPLTMSPEQARGEHVTAASDIFSFGVTLYRQLTCEWPFRGRTVADVLYAIQHEPARSPRDHEPTLPRALDSIVMRCLEKDPARRFSSMDELGVALDRFLDRRTLRQRVAAVFRRGRRSAAGPGIHPEEIS